MSYNTFRTYLEAGGFTLVTTCDEFEEQKKCVGPRAKLTFECVSGHVMSLTVSSLKNKKHKFKSNYEGFCYRCARSQQPVADLKTNTPPSMSSVNKQDSAVQVVDEEVSADQVVDEEVRDEKVEEEVPPLCSQLQKYFETEPEFMKYYFDQRPRLFSNYNKIGPLLFDNEPYFDLVQNWFVEHINLFTRTRLQSRDVFLTDNGVRVGPLPTLQVVIQTLTVYNTDPVGIHQMYYNKHHGNPYMVFICDNGEIVDVWYFVPGKKPYSVTYKHRVNVGAHISGYASHDENDYYYFEKTMFELEIIYK